MFDNSKNDREFVLRYINTFAKNEGIEGIKVNEDRIDEVIDWMEDEYLYPVKDISEASLFRKMGTFVSFFASNAPVSQPFPKGSFPKEILDIENHQNAILAFEISRYSLHGAKIIRNGEEVILENQIEQSRHSYIDIINGLAKIQSSGMTRLLVSALIEQMVYKANPDCEYPTP